MVLLAGQYYVGTNIAKQNYKKAIKWYLKAAEKMTTTDMLFGILLFVRQRH